MTNNEQIPATTDWKYRFLHFFVLNQRKVLQVSAAFIAICFLAIFWLAQDKGTQGLARLSFEQWKKAPGDESLTRDMEKALKKAPNLRQTLEAEIAQVFLIHGDVANADKRAVSCIARLQADSPFHAEFAKISLMIERAAYQKALEASVTLKERLLESSEAGSLLQGWNLLRLAFLQKKLENTSGEIAAWEEVKGFIERNPAGKSLEVGIGRKDFSLTDFITHRERELNKS